MDAIEKLKTLKLAPLEEAAQVQIALGPENLGGSDLSQNQLAKLIGQPQSWVAKRLALLDLTPKLMQALKEHKISMTLAYELSRLPPAKQKEYESRDLERLRTYDLRENRGKVVTHPACGAQFRVLMGVAKFCPNCGKEL